MPTTLKDELILSLMRENIKKRVGDFYFEVRGSGPINSIVEKSINKTTDEILRVIANTSKEISKK